MRPNRLILAGVVAVLAICGGAYADCTDTARPGVAWRRCLFDGRDLSGVDLTRSELRDGGFTRATLDRAVLAGADAYHAKFVSASLKQTHFDGARLTEADFTRSDLTGATFLRSDLRNAKFDGARLVDADLTGARIAGADLTDADLSGARWIDGTRICQAGSIGQCQ